MADLAAGEKIPTIENGEFAEVLSYIAEGGQGEVYKVRYRGRVLALKWYKRPAPGTAFYQNLEKNVYRGAPNNHFLWPIMLTARYKNTYGYLMELRPPEYKSFGDFLLGKATFESWGAMLEAALQIAESFRILHSIGYSYQDINEGGFFIKPDNGEVLICDTDNVAPYSHNLGVKGMPRYMAPEVVVNRSKPNTLSDRFSMAVLLFRLFYIDHPLEGAYTIRFPLTDAIGAQLYGVHPIFVYDPKDDRNRPTPEAQPNVLARWNIFPPDLQKIFLEAFTDGMLDVDRRITETRWVDTLVKVRGMLVRINGREQFVNVYDRRNFPDGCRLLVVGKTPVVLGDKSCLYACQTDAESTDFREVTAVVNASLSDRSLLGIGNRSQTTWSYRYKEGNTGEIRPGGFAALKSGMVIDFGGVIGGIL